MRGRVLGAKAEIALESRLGVMMPGPRARCTLRARGALWRARKRAFCVA